MQCIVVRCYLKNREKSTEKQRLQMIGYDSNFLYIDKLIKEFYR